MKRIAIFGGSFDPVHLGHIELVSSAKKAADLDQVIFMPCWQSPLKGKTTATATQRFEMVKSAIEEGGLSKWADVSDFEIARPEASYSWKTVTDLSSRYDKADYDWHWILGTDQWEQIESWAEPEKLREMLHFVVMTRDCQEVTSREGWSHTAVPFYHPASASKIRADFQGHRNWLPPAVAEYCERFSIYD